MNEQEFNQVRQQLRQEISRPYQGNSLDQQLNTERELQSPANINAPSNISARQFFSNNISNFSTSLPNLNTGSLNQISSTRNSQQPWTTDDLIEAERFYHRVNPIDIEPNLLSPDSRGRNAPLPRRNSLCLSESLESSPINRQVSQNIFFSNTDIDLSQTIDPGRFFLDQQNAERLSFEVPFIIAGGEVGSQLSPTNSNQSTRSNQGLEFLQTNSPTNFLTRYGREQTPFASPTPSSAPSPSNSSPRNSSSPVNSL